MSLNRRLAAFLLISAVVLSFNPANGAWTTPPTLSSTPIEGKVLYFSRWFGNPPYGYYIIDAATGTSTLIKEISDPGNYGLPIWSLDGKKILYATGAGEIWAMDNNGNNPVKLCTFGSGMGKGFVLTTNGILWRDGGDHKIYLGNLQTGGETMLIDLVGSFGTKDHMSGCAASQDGRVVYTVHTNMAAGENINPLISFDANMSNPTISWEQKLWTHGTIISNDGANLLNFYAGYPYSYRGWETTDPSTIGIDFHDMWVVHEAAPGTNVADMVVVKDVVGKIQYGGFAYCTNHNDYIAMEAGRMVTLDHYNNIKLYILNWKTKTLWYIPKPSQIPDTGETYSMLNGACMGTSPFWYGALPPVDGPSVTLSRSSVSATLATSSSATNETIGITNAGTGILPALQASVSSNASAWLSAAVTGGASNSQTLTLTIDPSSLSTGNYNATVAISGTGIGAVTAAVSLAYGYNVTAPSTLLAEIGFDGKSVSLTWADNSSDETGFVIERAAGNESFSQVGTTNANVNAFIDTGIAAGTYSWRVKAVKNSESSAYSNAVTLTLTGQARFAITSPTAGDVFAAGGNLPITWFTEAGLIDNAVIELSVDDGLTWNEINPGGGIAAGSSLWGNYTWTIPDTFHSIQCIIRIAEYGTMSKALNSGIFTITNGAGAKSILGRHAQKDLSIVQSGKAVKFTLPAIFEKNGTLEIFHASGARIFVSKAGTTVVWQNSRMRAGSYIVRLTSENKEAIARFVIVR